MCVYIHVLLTHVSTQCSFAMVCKASGLQMLQQAQQGIAASSHDRWRTCDTTRSSGFLKEGYHGVPQYLDGLEWKTLWKWMMTRGTPILGNLQIVYGFSYFENVCNFQIRMVTQAPCPKATMERQEFSNAPLVKTCFSCGCCFQIPSNSNMFHTIDRKTYRKLLVYSNSW